MEDRKIIQSENSRHVILSYKNTVYYVSHVNVYFIEGQDECRAIFHARKVLDNVNVDIDLNVNRRLYDLLIEYTQLNNPEVLLVLYVEENNFNWHLISEKWLKRYIKSLNAQMYIV